MLCRLIFLISISCLIDCHADNRSILWFNENHPWDSNANGNDVERFSLVQIKYPEIFDLSPWTGVFEIQEASEQNITNRTLLNTEYYKINDGFLCQAHRSKQCIDFKIGFEVIYNPCSVSGFRPNETSIPNGQPTRPHSLPWQVSIHYNEQYVCDGTLIDDRHILTSASCFERGHIPLLYSIKLGSHFLSNSTNFVRIERFIYHSDFNSQTLQNNIGIIKLQQSIQSFTNYITPACLARSIRRSSQLKSFLVSSWNAMESNQYTDGPKQTFLALMNGCSLIDDKFDDKIQLCLGIENAGNDTYRGGFGSGLFEKQLYDTERWMLNGIGSHRYKFTSQGSLAIYTRLSAYTDWIENTIKKMK